MVENTTPGGPETHCGFVALLGPPNSGKSTLMNKIVGAKVSIVTHKVQTTRQPVRGIVIRDHTQIVFVDTPGIFAPSRRLERAMVAAAWAGGAEAGQRVVLYDAQKAQVGDDMARIVDGLAASGASAILALNKIDLVARPKLLALAQELSTRGVFSQIFMISAETGDGVEDLIAHLAGLMPQSPWHFPEDQLSDASLRDIAAEVTREKLFLNLHQELPYSLTVETENWEDFDDGAAKIQQVIYVTKPQHKAMCLGKGGARIKAVRAAAQKELANFLGRPVHLFLFIKVREKWLDERERYSAMGLDFDA